jgi:HEAT repeat protein/energy-coupling factor transporter ATP-binding protein EcfA2
MELPSELKQALERLRAGITDAADLETLRRALQAGQIVLATGERAVAIGGSVEDTVIVTGDNNIVFKGATAESVREALQKVLERIASDRYAASLQEYFHALRRYCAELPYLTLTDIRPPKNLDEVYVPLRARQRENEPSPRKPAAQEESLTVEQVLRQAQTHHLLILGQPGAGKSTLLRQLAERAYDAPHAIGLDRPHLPLLLPLRALAHAEGALEERLNQALQNELRLTRPLPAGFLDAWPQRLDTPWLFLLDGLDEVPADRYLSLRQWISDLLTRPDVARVIITSRPSAYTEKEWESSRLSVYEIQPFTPDQTAELARRWFGEDAPAFLQALETVRSSVLTETPLLITIAAKVYLERKRLPERRAQLYQEFVDIWLDEARERGLRDELDAAVLDLAQPTLAHLALAMTDHPDWTDEKSLIPVVVEYLNEQLNLKARAPAVAERFLRVMARRSGVFLKREERYEWVHPTFREYFAALALNQQLESGKSFEEVLGERVLQEKWAETIVALAEICPKPAELIIWLTKLRAKRRQWCKLWLGTQKQGEAAILAWRCCKVSRARTDTQVRTAILDALIDALRAPLPGVRWRAGKALGETGDARAIKPLITALGDSDTVVQLSAASALGEIGDARASKFLIALLLRHPFREEVIVEALLKIGTPAIKQLIAVMHDDPEIRGCVEDDLYGVRDARAIDSLIIMLRDPEKDVRIFAASALRKIGDARAVEPLIAALNDTSMAVRFYAMDALGKIGDVRAVEPLIALLCDPDPNVRREAIEVLGRIGDTRAVRPLIVALRDPDSKVRREAAYALGKIGDPSAVEPLIAALRDTDAGVRIAVANVLGDIRDVRALPELERLSLEDKGSVGHWWWSENVADIARKAIASIRESTELLIATLCNPDEDIREHMANAIEQVKDVSPVEPLIDALRNPDENVRKRTAEVLGKIGDVHALELLIAALGDPNASIRWSAAGVLGNIGDPRALPELERLARGDPNESVATVAREAIARIRERMEKTD